MITHHIVDVRTRQEVAPPGLLPVQTVQHKDTRHNSRACTLHISRYETHVNVFSNGFAAYPVTNLRALTSSKSVFRSYNSDLPACSIVP
jgi:hypothetical protein